MILYGLPTCTDCKKALKALEDAGHKPTFRDVRAEPLSEAEWAPLIAEFGDNIIDRKSQIYRNLNAWMRESEAEAQLMDQPALMARPIITDGARMTLGWDDAAQSVWLA
ncbi:arsenate reductase family protein [Sulfitobacter sp. JB4-11]|uniref:arsenate reductase family protein n=1 Tax=Sulfitobacter rhodophyticola TaxID=3238304 RepID=UPI003513986D